MARVTVEDCVEVINNRFELVALAAERAKNIAAGAAITVDRDNDKNAVIALREIADSTVDIERLRETLIQNNQRYATSEAEEDSAIAEEDNSTAAKAEEGNLPSSTVSSVSDASAKEAVEDIATLSGQGDVTETDGFSFGDDNLDVDD